MPNDERNLETMPDGALGLIPLESCKELGLKVDQYTALLSQKNVKFEKKATSDTHGVKDGYVVKCSKEIGETVNVKDSEKVTVYYAKSGGSSSSSSTSSKTN